MNHKKTIIQSIISLGTFMAQFSTPIPRKSKKVVIFWSKMALALPRFSIFELFIAFFGHFIFRPNLPLKKLSPPITPWRPALVWIDSILKLLESQFDSSKPRDLRWVIKYRSEAINAKRCFDFKSVNFT